MTLLPGCRFAVAPRFHLPADWPRRLRVGAGVGEADGGFVARGPWRPPTADELSLLVPAADGPTAPEDVGTHICLFRLPEHLRSGWWELLERSAGSLGEGRLPGFDSFVSRVGEFLAFKGLPLAEGARCDVVVSHPGPRGADPGPGPWGGVNLGDEGTSVILLNLPRLRREAELRRRFPDRPPSAVGEPAGGFLRGCPDYPPVRLALGPGEGYRLPEGGLILVGDPGGEPGPDLLLRISRAVPPAA